MPDTDAADRREPLNGTSRFTVPAGHAAGAAARRALRSTVDTAGLDRLELLVTTLVAEVASPAEIELTVVGGPAPLVTVTHPGTGVPGGYHRAVLDRYADRWGTHRTGPATSIWFTVDPGGTGTGEGARRTVEALIGIAPPTADGPPVARFAQRVVDVLAEQLQLTGCAVELDRADTRGRGVLVAAGRPGGDPDQRLPLPVSRPWTAELLITTGGTPPDPAACDLAVQRLGAALETERLREAEHRRHEWLTYVIEVGDLLAQSIDVALTAALIPRLVVPRLGLWCALYLAGPGGALDLTTAAHVDEAMTAAMLTADGEFGRHLRSAAVTSALGGTTATPLTGPCGGLAVPLRAHGELIGGLAIGQTGTGDLTTARVAQEVARRAATALDHARVHDERGRISHTLQQALRPAALPEIPGLDVGAQYVPAGPYTEVGGDLYDVIATPGGGALALIGDVAGKGVDAATVTSVVREVLRVLVAEGKPLGDIISVLNTTLHQRSERYCTLAFAEIHPAEPASGAVPVTLHLGGHDQPMLVRATGEVSTVGTWGTAVGLLPQIHCPPETVTLAPGDSLILYTDGVTERRDGADFLGPERLRQAAAQLAGHPAEIIASSLATMALGFSAEAPRDDMAILAIRNDNGPAGPSRPQGA